MPDNRLYEFYHIIIRIKSSHIHKEENLVALKVSDKRKVIVHTFKIAFSARINFDSSGFDYGVDVQL